MIYPALARCSIGRCTSIALSSRVCARRTLQERRLFTKAVLPTRSCSTKCTRAPPDELVRLVGLCLVLRRERRSLREERIRLSAKHLVRDVRSVLDSPRGAYGVAFRTGSTIPGGGCRRSLRQWPERLLRLLERHLHLSCAHASGVVADRRAQGSCKQPVVLRSGELQVGFELGGSSSSSSRRSSLIPHTVSSMNPC